MTRAPRAASQSTICSEDFAALGGDFFRGVEIREVALGKAEIAVEGIEEDLEGSLQACSVPRSRGSSTRPEGVLGLNSECAKIPQHSAEDAEGIVLWQSSRRPA